MNGNIVENMTTVNKICNSLYSPHVRTITRNFFKKLTESRFGKYKIVEPGHVSPENIVPSFIVVPEYYKTGVPSPGPELPEIKTKEQIDRMRDSCRLAANILKAAGNFVEVGKTTDEIDNFIHYLIIKNKAYPSPLYYKFFPKSVCTSVNNVVCHGIPDDRPLQNGDIVNIDITVFYNGFHGDCSKTFLVGDVDEYGKHLVQATEACLTAGITYCKPGRNFCGIGRLIEETARNLGYNIVPAFVGHGIGEYFHGAPDIYHIDNNYPGQMAKGMTFTIEPVLTPGCQEIDVLEDGWTAVTTDFARTAQFEHTILITENGAEILTVPD